MLNNETFYPTPKPLIDRMLAKIQGRPQTILEPSAGAGTIIKLSAWLGHQVIPRPCGMSDDPGRPYRSGDMGRFAQPDSAR